uniref:Uncharacterized protein n=1 Tax=Trichobilharzia regenti TaxID=157069 RepID=A0AA85IQF0_TRIRE|nr:unnamed protein product [Trichobilharzia regenti]
MPQLVLTSTVLTNPSPLQISLTTTPKCHLPVAHLSATNTMSPTFKFRHNFFHLSLVCSVRTYSFNHLFQNISLMCLACFHLLIVGIRSPLASSMPGLFLNNNNLFGVNTSKSLTSSLTGDNGRSFNIRSASQKNVSSVSSFKLWFLIMELKIRLIIPISLSHSPPLW